MRKPDFSYVKTKAYICFAVTAKLISLFVFATQIVHFFSNKKFQASSLLLFQYSLVYVRPVRKSRCWFLRRRLIWLNFPINSFSVISGQIHNPYIPITGTLCSETHMSLCMRKPTIWVSDQV